MATSILNRKLDLLYLVYFVIHLPIMFLIDMSSIYPAYLKTPATHALIAFSKEHYRDYLLVPREGESAPAFFLLFMWMELFFQVPICVWAIWGLVSDHPKIPLVLSLYSFQTVLTTMTCIAEYFSWTDITFQEKLDLTTLYGPYIVLATLMLVDMTVRLNGLIDKATVSRVVGAATDKKTL